MGHGYHSRSPEEFKKYMAELNSAPKTKTWRNILIFIDILLLLLVLYMASKKMNPSSGISVKSSSKISISPGFQIYLVKSSVPPPGTVAYFLFLANSTREEVHYGRDKVLKLVVKSETGKECLYKEFQLDDKKVNPGMSESFSFFFEKIPEKDLDEECQSVYRKPAFPRTLDTFLKKKYRIDTVLLIEDKNGDKKELVLTDDNW